MTMRPFQTASAFMSPVKIAVGAEVFPARFCCDAAPESCRRLKALLPYRGEVIHARWSGEAIWSPLAAVWPAGLVLPPENRTSHPGPGEVLLYAGAQSEPELLFVYGNSRFASQAGPLEGNPVLVIDDDLERLAAVGREVLRRGALMLRIALSEPALQIHCEET